MNGGAPGAMGFSGVGFGVGSREPYVVAVSGAAEETLEEDEDSLGVLANGA